MTALISQRDEKDTLREYETIYVLRPDLAQDQIAGVNGRVRGILEGRGGKLLRVENWGKRKLAYRVARQARGIYLYWRYLGPADLVAELERNLKIADECIRYLTVKLDENVRPDARPAEVDEEGIAAASSVGEEDEGAADDLPPDGFEDLAAREEE